MRRRAEHLDAIAKKQREEALAYAERIRKALPEVVRPLREKWLSMYELEHRTTVRRQTTSLIEGGDCTANFLTIALMSFVLAGNLTEFCRVLDTWKGGGGDGQKRQ